ncbi:MAG: N-acetylmuramic acid 6-phosphate etherase [Bacteroidia bacterium]
MDEKITEQSSAYRHLEQMSTSDLQKNMNKEDKKVAYAVEEKLPEITNLTEAIYLKMRNGGRLFYIGSGTSGRLGILDASECPPTFGVPQGMVVGIIAGGDAAIRQAQEFAEDDALRGWQDLLEHDISDKDFVLGLSASGTTPYVAGGLKQCQEQGIRTGCITCNPTSPVAMFADYPIEIITGPEFVTGSTRMKAGTAQKLVLNMISTALMVRMGRVRDNKMVDMQLSNKKLIDRGSRMIVELYGIGYDEAREMLLQTGSVRQVIEDLNRQTKE